MTYPRYFIVDDIPVKVDKTADGQVFGENDLGNPYPIGKALIEGVEVDYEEFKREVKRRAASW